MEVISDDTKNDRSYLGTLGPKRKKKQKYASHQNKLKKY